MDQQHSFNPATGHPETHAGEAGRHEAPGMPLSTVLSKGEWLAVSTDGFSEQQRGRPLEHLVKELAQNAMDSVGDSGRIDLDIQPISPWQAIVRCADNGPGVDDLSRLNVVFVTNKKDGVTQCGRMGRGFKELLSVATHAAVRSRDQGCASRWARTTSGASLTNVALSRIRASRPSWRSSTTRLAATCQATSAPSCCRPASCWR